MKSLQHNPVKFNSKISFDFNGGNLSSDSGLLLVRSFMEKIGLREVMKDFFDSGTGRLHSVSSVIEQLIYTNISGYHQDDASDELRHDPVFTSILDKEALASQPTVSRVLNSFSEADIEKFNDILKALFRMGNSPEDTKHIVLDIDSTNIQTYGKQENSEYIYHYSSNGYHPLVLYNGLNGDMMKFELRKGSVYTSKDIRKFLGPVLKWLNETYPKADILIRGDSGFATPELYQLAEEYEVDYVIRLKSNASLRKLSEENEKVFQNLHGNDFTHHYAVHGEIDYMAGSWDKYRRVICRTERNAGELLTRNSFIVTSLKTDPKKIIKVYNRRGMMENFIKETKLDFGMTTLSHSSFNANHAKAMILTIAYSIMNIMKRLVLPKEFRNSRMLSLRTFFIKIACRAIRSARKTVLRFCSSYPYKDKFLESMLRIDALQFA
jgi:hypothetical protein